MRGTPPAIHPYEEVRLRQCMQNSARLRQLGLQETSVYPNTSAIAQDKNKRYQRTREDSGSEYDPLQDAFAEGDISDGTTTTTEHGSKTNNQALDASSGLKFRSRKRVYADMEPTTTCAKSKKRTAQPNVSVLASDIPVPPSPATIEGDGAHVANNTRDECDNEMTHEDVVDANPQSANTTRDECNDEMANEEVPWNRGINMGHGLQRITRSRRGKLPIIIPEGHIRPLTPVIAAKYATECNIAVRGHVPILLSWQDYKKREAIIQKYLGCLRAKFDIDTEDPVIKEGCLGMMKIAIRNQRHRLKEEHFDPYPLHLVTKTSPVTSTSDEEWLKLVEYWSTAKKMEQCQKNKNNRAQVKFPSTTGSCSYPVFVENLGGEFEDKEPNALDLFKLCHFSKKTQGYTPNVQLAIDEMEAQLTSPPGEGEEPNSTTEVVAAVLEDNTKKNMFLQNVGIKTARQRSTLQKVQAQLEVEKQANVDLRAKVDDLEKKAKESEQARLKDKEEMKKQQDEFEARLERRFRQHLPAD
ncbi:unnamed protein product [Urochloa decumbens]|uniref:Transposase n=1 Tax=Urochloa decumbens TaxID=240449 RepID=A0ABC8X182_9POAL